MDSGWAETLARARERLLSTGEFDADAPLPRDDILASWRRSYDDGAHADRVTSPFDENLNLSSKLVRAAAPVIRRVHEDVEGSPISVILTDSRGKVLIRLCGEHFLESSLDAVLLAPGFSYAERYVGTNGIGTALEARQTSLVRGREHFNEALQAYACVGVPLRDPVTSRVLGALDVTTWADLANPALTALVRQAGSVIEEGLLEVSGRGAKALLQEYLHAARDRDARVLGISADAVLAGPSVTRLLGGLPAEDLWPIAAGALAGRSKAKVPLLLPSGEQANLHLRSVTRDGALVGAVIEIDSATETVTGGSRAPSSPMPHVPGLAGLSPAVQTVGAALSHAAKARRISAIVGETGVGKLAVVRAVAAYELSGRRLVVLEVAEERPDVVGLAALAAAAITDASPVLVRRAELLPAGAISALLARVAPSSGIGSGGLGWLTFSLRVGSAGGGASAAEEELRGAGVPVVALAPLRARSQDLELIVPAMVRKHSGGRAVALTPQLIARLARDPWPENLAEVDALIRDMVHALRDGTELDVRHLPSDRGRGMRRRLTAMEWITRDAVLDALRASGGDRGRAAEILGMSRASVYRKIKAFDIRPSDFEA